ncbi:hypothetical protein [uncultured Dysosmobacter sp.]|uniref:hypothetical protein n=1 Tax=uncultured Dysosmobacter sp. TaxID=2591384 RepID=UPI002626F801|nr:hypothetical protein [uncultured Dysosmobacter sp.]
MNRKSAGTLIKRAGSYLYHEGTVYIILAVLVVFFAILNPVFLTGSGCILKKWTSMIE